MHPPHTRFSWYRRLLGEAWRLLARKPLAMLPTTYAFVGFVVLAGLVTLARWGLQASDTAITVIGVLLGLGLVIHAGAMQMGVMGRIATGGDTTFRRAFHEATARSRRMAGLLGVAVLAALPLIVVWLALQIISMWYGMPLTHPLKASLLLVFFIGAVVYGAWFLFILPLGRFHKSTAWNVFRKAWRLLHKDAGHVWLTFLGVVLVCVGIEAVLGGLAALTGGGGSLGWALARTVVGVTASVWLSLFVFLSYVEYYHPLRKKTSRKG